MWLLFLFCSHWFWQIHCNTPLYESYSYHLTVYLCRNIFSVWFFLVLSVKFSNCRSALIFSYTEEVWIIGQMPSQFGRLHWKGMKIMTVNYHGGLSYTIQDHTFLSAQGSAAVTFTRYANTSNTYFSLSVSSPFLITKVLM